MKYSDAKIARLLINFFGNDDRRISHAMSVLFHAKRIAAEKGGCSEDIIVACALLHDVGIKPAEGKFGCNDGKLQEEFGPPIAEELLRQIDFPIGKIQIVKEIIGNHHSKSRFAYPELEVLKEADRIVNRESE